MASTAKSVLLAGLTALILAGCNATAGKPSPNYGYGYGGPGYGHGGYGGPRPDRGPQLRPPPEFYGERGLLDGKEGRPWLCDRNPDLCGADSEDPRRAMTAYRDGWRQGWTELCRANRDRRTQNACDRALGEGWDRRRDDFFRFGR